MRKKNLLTIIGIIVAISTTITTGIVATKCLQNKETEISKISEETANETTEIIEKTTYAGKDTDNLLAENDVIGTWDASATEQDHVTATLYSDGRFVISGTGKMKGYSYSNDRPWYTNQKEIKTAEIQKGVTCIGYYAFDECSSLTSITIPNSVTSIGTYAFYKCSSLTSINIPEGVTSIGWRVFKDCSSLTSITIPNSVTSIGGYAFEDCSSLTSIVIPDSVTSIEKYPFYCCSSLTAINVNENNKKYTSENGVLFNKDKTEIICYPVGKEEKEYNISSSVTSIGKGAFYGCSSLTSINIPEGVTSIGEDAFGNCSSLTSINIPNSVTSIGGYAFEDCSSLTSIVIPDSVTSIGYNAFDECSSLTAINVNENNKKYTSENGVLFNKDKTEIIRYPAGKEEKEYNIPSSVTSIGSWAFGGCSSLTSINIPNSVTSIGRYAFKDCSSLTSINIPSSVTRIGDGAFEDCSSLTSIVIPDSVTSIGEYAFSRCSNLTSINIPSSVTSIEESAFSGCSSLTSINIPSSVTSIGSDAFYGCRSLTSITIPSSVTSIGSWAFGGCSSLTSINIPEGVTSIERGAFYGCKHIEVVAIGEKTEGKVTIQLPELVKRSLDENDILYAKGKEPILTNCTISKEEGTMTFKAEDINKKDIKIEINYGALEGVTVVVVPSGTIFYSETNPTAKDVTATIFIAEGEEMINNNGSKEHVFTENGTFTFKYKDKEGKEKEATAKVDNILLKGDANGDSKVDLKDILAINKHRLGKAKLTGGYLETADVTGDNKVDLKDILQINKYRLGKIKEL